MTKTFASIIALLASLGLSQAATVDFLFDNNTELDGNQPAGAIMSRSENGETVVLTTLTITAPDFNEVDPYANLITTNVDTSINNPAGLGVNNPSTNNSDFDLVTGAGGSEGNNLNYLESITVEFNETVHITTIDFASLGGSIEFVRINVEGFATNYDFFNGNTNDIFADPLSGLYIPAGSDVTFTGLGGAGDTNMRIDSFTVDVVPEPSGALLVFLGGALCLRRHRK
ncbi:PEP-CTERM sorting domain-containing protein [Haloferula sp.]|uniref:PEP-CTERM sorting domain-containing protein n=1 Tax=Haloferula sp. TaxID=2497595 RepID=UPI0032A02AD5